MAVPLNLTIPMSTFSVLQISLDQAIAREVLEEASDAVPSVVRADCAAMQRDLFGIVVSGLPFEEATAFQIALKQRGFATEVVADQEIPVLHEPFTVQRIGLQKEVLVFTDTMGRVQSRPREDLVFVAGGFLTQSRIKSVLVMGSSSPARMHGFDEPAHPEKQHRFEEVPEFRLDFFFWSSPNRLRAAVSAESMMFFHDRPLRLRDTVLLLGAMMDLQELLPPERVGSGLKRTDTKNFYPSLRSYEEEIRWHFHRLKSRA
jgi:hypothetical protein